MAAGAGTACQCHVDPDKRGGVVGGIPSRGRRRWHRAPAPPSIASSPAPPSKVSSPPEPRDTGRCLRRLRAHPPADEPDSCRRQRPNRSRRSIPDRVHRPPHRRACRARWQARRQCPMRHRCSLPCRSPSPPGELVGACAPGQRVVAATADQARRPPPCRAGYRQSPSRSRFSTLMQPVAIRGTAGRNRAIDRDR